MGDLRSMQKLILSGEFDAAAQAISLELELTPENNELLGLAKQLSLRDEQACAAHLPLLALLELERGHADGFIALLTLLENNKRWGFLFWLPTRPPDMLDHGLLYELFDALLKCPSPPPQEHPALLEKLQPYLDLALQMEHGPLWCQASALHRRFGELEQALTLAQRAFERWPHGQSALCKARALRALGHEDDAILTYAEAISYPKSAIVALMEQADYFQERGHAQLAISNWRAVLQQEPLNTQAKALLLYHRCLLERDMHWRRELQEQAKLYPECALTQALNAQIEHRAQPFIGYLPQPGDALINTLQDLSEAQRLNPPRQLGLSSVEAPSAVSIFIQTIEQAPQVKAPKLYLKTIQSPDPRFPLAPVEHLLWTYHGDDPVAQPVSGPIPQTIIARITDLASQPFDLELWWAQAARLGHELGPEQLWPLLRLMVNWPARPPQTRHLWAWVQQVQLACAMTIAQTEDGWRASARKAALTSLARGIPDWTTEAALTAMTQLAITSQDHPEAPAIIEDITGLCAELVRAVPAGAYCCYEYALMCNMLRMPWLDGELRSQLMIWRKSLE